MDYERDILESIRRGLPLSKTKHSLNITWGLATPCNPVVRKLSCLAKIAFWFYVRYTLLPNLFGIWVVLFLPVLTLKLVEIYITTLCCFVFFHRRNKHGVPQEKIAQMLDRFSFPISVDIVMSSQEPLHVNRRRRPE